MTSAATITWVSAVHRRLRGVTLDDAFVGGHLGALGIGDVRLEFLALAVLAWQAACQELAGAGSFFAQGLQLGLAFGF